MFAASNLAAFYPLILDSRPSEYTATCASALTQLPLKLVLLLPKIFPLTIIRPTTQRPGKPPYFPLLTSSLTNDALQGLALVEKALTRPTIYKSLPLAHSLEPAFGSLKPLP